MSSIFMFYLMIGLVPRRSVCHLLATFVHRSFPCTPPAPPPSPHALVRVLCHSSCCPPRPYSLGHDPRRIRGSTILAQPQPRATSPRTVRLLQRPSGINTLHFSVTGKRAVSTPNTNKGASSVDPYSVARNSLRYSTMHIYEVLKCPPCLGFSPPAISRTLLDWVTSPCFVVPRPPQGRAAVYPWSFRFSHKVSS